MCLEINMKNQEKKLKENDDDIISWERNELGHDQEDLIHVYPSPGDNIKKKKYFAVKDYEKALFYNKGELVGIIEGGIFEIDKTAKVKGTEIIWIDTAIKPIHWGVPLSSGIPTNDGITIGMYGTLTVRISDVKIFYQDIVAGKKKFTTKDLKDFINNWIRVSIREVVKNYNVMDILTIEREHIMKLLTAKLNEQFEPYGLEFESFNIVGVKIPEELEEFYKF